MTDLKGEPSTEVIALLKKMSSADHFGEQHTGHGGQRYYLAPGDETEQDVNSSHFVELVNRGLIKPKGATVPGGPRGKSGQLDHLLTDEGKRLLEAQTSPGN